MSLLNQFRVLKERSGTITELANGTMLLVSASGSDGARLYRDFPAIPGVTYTMLANVKVVSGSGATTPFIAVDYPTAGSLVVRKDLSNEIEQHRLSYTVPYDANPSTDLVTFAAGIFGGTSGSIEISGVEFSSDKQTTEWELAVTDFPVVGGGATIVADIIRVGNVVNISGELVVTGNIAASEVVSGIAALGVGELLPVWATPKRKEVSWCNFSTGGSFMVAIEVEAGVRSITVFKRGINTVLTASPIGTTNQPFSMSFVCE